MKAYRAANEPPVFMAAAVSPLEKQNQDNVLLIARYTGRFMPPYTDTSSIPHHVVPHHVVTTPNQRGGTARTRYVLLFEVSRSINCTRITQKQIIDTGCCMTRTTWSQVSNKFRVESGGIVCF